MSLPAKAAELVTAYRIVKREFVARAFSGEGARLYGGRWNSPGVSIVYTSSSISLAILEWRAHLSQWPAPPVMIIEIQFPLSVIWTPSRLPRDWAQTPAPKSTAALGNHWVKSGKSSVLKLSSAIIPKEFNYLLNPAHPQFGMITRGRARLFEVDPRLGALAVTS